MGFGSHIDRQAELAMKDPHAAGVVHMIVGDEDRIDRPNVPAMLGKPFLGSNAAYPSVKEQPDAACFDVDAVAVAAGLERDDLHVPFTDLRGMTRGLNGYCGPGGGAVQEPECLGKPTVIRFDGPNPT